MMDDRCYGCGGHRCNGGDCDGVGKDEYDELSCYQPYEEYPESYGYDYDYEEEKKEEGG